jgi:hypothetical protein
LQPNGGDVGIGTSTPTSPLHLVGVGRNGEFAVERSGGARFIFQAQTSVVTMGTTTATPFAMLTNSTQRIYVSSSGSVGIFTQTPDRLFHVESLTANANAVQQNVRITHTTTGAPVAGIGVGVEFEVETSNNNNEVGATIEAVTTDVTATSEDFDLVFKTMAAGAAAAERMRLNNIGLGIGGVSPTAFADLAASTTSQASMRIRGGVDPTSPNDGDMWGSTAQKAFYMYAAGMKQSAPGVIFTQTADKTVTNTVTETSIIGTGVGTLTLPANFFVAGKTIRLRVGGVYSTPALGGAVTVRVKYGATTLASVTTTSLLGGAASLEFDGEVLITCRTTGATGTVMTHGDIEYATGVSGTIAVNPLNNGGATTTINTTTSNLLDVTAQWDLATADRIAKSTVTTVEVLN